MVDKIYYLFTQTLHREKKIDDVLASEERNSNLSYELTTM
jgi:hypothetical protein